MATMTRFSVHALRHVLLGILILLSYYPNDCSAFVGAALNKVQKDFAALTRRVTAHHILVANQEVALALKQKIRDECADNERWIVDVFEQAARKYSQDETTNNNERGGLLGDLVPQGYCQSQILDRACFEVDLGTMHGPLKSEFGYHVLLVTERTNCPKLDGKNTKLIQTSSKDVFGTLVPSAQVGKIKMSEFVVNQLGFWLAVFLAGGLVAELAAKIVEMV
jgi:peptidyl-prolyl cis-trans isomerase C